jgi:hypothetical protein
MEGQAAKKIVVIRKKTRSQDPKNSEPEKVEVQEVAEITRNADKKRARRKRRMEKWQKTHPGMRQVIFAIDTELWNRFVAQCCSQDKPNAVFTAMIQEAVAKKEKDNHEPR